MEILLFFVADMGINLTGVGGGKSCTVNEPCPSKYHNALTVHKKVT